MDIKQLKELFIEEASEVIEKLSIDIINFEENPSNIELLDELYRGVHTLKGSANAFEFSKLGNFVHHFEDALSYCRNTYNNRDNPITSTQIDIFLEAIDLIKEVLQIEVDGSDILPKNYSNSLQNIKQIVQTVNNEINQIDENSDSGAELNIDLGAEFDNKEVEDTESSYEVLEINLDISIDEVTKLKQYIMKHLDSLQEIKIHGELNQIISSSLLQLLFSLKKTKPSLDIPLVDSDFFLHPQYKKIIWVK